MNECRSAKKEPREALVLAIAVLFFVVHPMAQGQYYLNRTALLADSTSIEPIRRIAIPPQVADVRSLGMGETRIADREALSSFVYNPGFLGASEKTGGMASLSAISPLQTINAVIFLSNNSGEFDNAFSLGSLKAVVDAYKQGIGLEEQIQERLEKIGSVTRDLLDNVVGDPRNPDIHGVNVVLSAQMQYGHWGFSVQGFAQTGMGAFVGPVFSSLLEIYLQTDFGDQVRVADAATRLEGLLDQIIDPVTGRVATNVLPGFYSLSYSDLMGTAGYGFQPIDSLSIGFQLKIINRRFGASRITVDEASSIADQIFGGFSSSTTGLTFDVGGMYRFPSGVAVGMNIQNVIPMATLTSEYYFDFESIQIQQDRQSDGSPIVDTNGDTALVVYSQNVTVTGPSRLALPIQADIGISIPMTEDWDVSFQLSDIAKQASLYNNYSQRFGFGTEYRFNLFNDNIRLAPRAGMANTEFTLGLGLNFGDVVKVNVGYATSRVVQSRRNFGFQLSVGW